MGPTDEQRLVLHICRQAEKRGRDAAWITRQSMMDNKTVPQGVGVRLVMAALLMPAGILEWSEDQQSFRLSEAVSRYSKPDAPRSEEDAP